MATPIYGSSLEETIKILSMCFTNCDNQTNEITICPNNCSLELLPFTLLAFTFIVFTLLAIVYFLYLLSELYSFLVSIKNNHTHYSTLLCTKGHISGLQGLREQIVYLQLLVGSTLKYLLNCTAVIPCTWGLSASTRVLKYTNAT